MLIYPQDLKFIGLCVVIPTLFEFFRIILGYLVAAPPRAVKQLEKQKLELQTEIASIKSIQVELVRHSKLERQVIKIDKELETLKAGQQPKSDKLKKIMRIIRVIVYIAAGVYLGLVPIVLISPQVLWPFSWISSEETIALQPWFFIFVASAAVRHILRSLAHVLFPNSLFP